MDGRQHLEAAIGKHGSVANAARVWRIPQQSLYSVVSGRRGVSRKQAAKWAALSNDELNAELLVWIRAIRIPQSEASNG